MITPSESSTRGAIIIGGDYQGLGIARNLAHLRIPIHIFDPDFCIGRFSRHIHQYHKCPPPTDTDEFIKYLVRFAAERQIRNWVVFPTTDTAVYTLSKSRYLLDSYYLVPTPEWDVIRFVYDKKLTYEIASRIRIPIPKTHFPRNEAELEQLDLEYPVILKPSIKDHFFSVTRKKAIQVNSRQELLHFYRLMASIIDASEIMVQELIPGGPDHLYSFCSLFSSGGIKAKITARRPRQHPMDFGSATTYAYTCDIPELEAPSEKLLQRIHYYGLSEVEFMYDMRERTFKLLEINPRTWGWHTLGARAGVNFSLLLFLDINGLSVKTNSYEKNVKWIRELTDTGIAIQEIWKGRMKPMQYLKTIRGKKELAVYDRSDPLPFFLELVLAPYFWYKKGRNRNGIRFRRLHYGGADSPAPRP
ncbi:MAG: ATP-grasp domain-containing protein [Syntrophales bacterium]